MFNYSFNAELWILCQYNKLQASVSIWAPQHFIINLLHLLVKLTFAFSLQLGNQQQVQRCPGFNYERGNRRVWCHERATRGHIAVSAIVLTPVRWALELEHHVDRQVRVSHLTGDRMALGCTMEAHSMFETYSKKMCCWCLQRSFLATEEELYNIIQMFLML